jgi:hypothetical protein
MKEKRILGLALVGFALLTPTMWAGGQKEVVKDLPATTKVTDIKPAEIKNHINFESVPGNLTMHNMTSADVLVFAGRVDQAHLIGGMRAGATRTFDISKAQAFSQPESGFQRKGSIMIRAVAVQVVEKFLDSKVTYTDDGMLYAQLLTYDLDDPKDKTDINIFKNMDASQSSFIYVSNRSPYILELRVDRPDGEKLTSLPPLVENRKIWLNPKDDGLAYRLFPTYVYVDPRTREIQSFTNVTDYEGTARVIPDRKGAEITPKVFTGPSKSAGATYSVAFITLKNETSEGVDFLNGGTLLRSQKGIRFTDTGRSEVFELNSQREDGEPYTGLNFFFDGGKTLKIGPVKLKPGYKYILIATEENGVKKYMIDEGVQTSRINEARMVLVGE